MKRNNEFQLWTMRLLASVFSVMILGCGAAPGGDSLDGANSDLGLPLSGAGAQNNTSWALFKDGSYTAAQSSFSKVISSTDATAQDLADANAGIGWAKVKTTGSSAGIEAFRAALAKSTKQPEARVGLAGALISQGSKDNINEAITMMEGIDPNNANFTFHDRYNTGVSNAEVHAMLAYAYFVAGNRTKADEQINIARDLDANLSGTAVDQIDEILSFIP